MQAKIENNVLIVRIPLKPAPTISSTGKTLVIASGNAKIEHSGNTVTVGINAHMPRPSAG